ncbi:MAG: TlpA family protein disulfide reductase [Polyangiaceae bacterium]|nr:TlpA family protein disulfide reductase [Polyangiaceae bacterium]
MSSSRSGLHARAATFAVVAAGAACTGGCVSGEDPPTPLAEPGFSVVEDYPDGPYGVGIGDVISPFVFRGYVRPEVDKGEAHRVIFGLPDFYSGEEALFPPGSPFGAGNPKPVALLVNVGAVWCTPCQYEASKILPGEHAKYAPRGGEFLMNLAQSAALGTPATWTDLDNWIKAYDVVYPAVLDDEGQLGALFDPNSYPANVIIDTRTMQIVESVSGVPQETFWTKFEALLGPP